MAMYKLSSRRYTGAKTRLLSHIDSVFVKHLRALQDRHNLSFFDVFAGTGVVSEYFMRHYGLKSSEETPRFTHFIINDFLHSNYAIYNGFFGNESFDIAKLQNIAQGYNALDKIPPNYYTRSFGNLFFSLTDSSIIGHIRDDLDNLLGTGTITKREFYILLSSLIYSTDRVANTVGHYDAYRKNVACKIDFVLGL